MSSDLKGNVAIAISLVVLVISTAALCRSWPELSSLAMTPAAIDGVDATP
jgi:hypothetical protein